MKRDFKKESVKTDAEILLETNNLSREDVAVFREEDLYIDGNYAIFFGEWACTGDEFSGDIKALAEFEIEGKYKGLVAISQKGGAYAAETVYALNYEEWGYFLQDFSMETRVIMERIYVNPGNFTEAIMDIDEMSREVGISDIVREELEDIKGSLEIARGGIESGASTERYIDEIFEIGYDLTDGAGQPEYCYEWTDIEEEE